MSVNPNETEAEKDSRTFQLMLVQLIYRHSKGLPLDKHMERAAELIRRKGTLSPLRNQESPFGKQTIWNPNR